MFHAHPNTSSLPRRLAAVLLAGLACSSAAAVARAGVPWHGTLEQAKSASLISHRPVLVVFTARWSEASVKLEQTALASEEAVALVTACFEPVKVDVDADPATTRRMGVSYLPTACVIDGDERVLSSFDCPESSAGFVAAAGRAAQDAALARSGTASLAKDGAAKEREQSDVKAAAADATASTATANAAGSPPSQADETLPRTPPAWTAETTTTPLATSTPQAAGGPPVRQSLEPTLPQADTTTPPPWLGPQQADQRLATATPPAAGAQPAVPPPATATPAPPKKPSPPWLSALQKPFTIFGRPALPSTTDTKTPANPTPTATAAAAAADPYASMPVGLEGYCPVTLAEKSKWVEGRAQWGVRHRGRTYLFAGPEEQRAFLADPDRYAPALSGDDPVVAMDTGKSTPGQRRYGVTYQSRMYLFSSPESRAAFAADPLRYTTRVAIAERTAAGSVVR